MRGSSRRVLVVGVASAGLVPLLAMFAWAQEPVPTPSDNDVPRPVPVEVSLAGAERPDISRFLNVQSAVAPSLSPDGRQLAFRTQITGQAQLWVVDVEGGWPTQLTFGEAVTDHRWSPAGAQIFYAVDRGGNEREGFYLITPDGRVERELLPPSDAFREFGGFTEDGQTAIYASTQRNGLDFDIYALDVGTGEAREVQRGRMGLYARAFSPDGRYALLVEARGEDANDLFLLDVSAGTLDTLAAPPDRALYDSFAWMPDGSGFYLVSNEGREFAGVAYFDLGRREIEYLETPAHDVEQVSLSADGRYLAWVVNEEGYSVIHARDLVSGAGLASPQLPPGVYSMTWAAQAAVAAITVQGPQVPGDIWTWRPADGTVQRATTSAAAGLDLAGMIVPEHHSFAARDGVTLHGFLYRPSTGELEPPVVLYVHGGPTAQARPTFDRSIQYLLTRGVAVFDLNYRGSTGYGKAFARLNDGRLREDELGDLADALEYLDTLDVQASRAAILGGSYGGYLSMAALARLPERFRAGVAFVGVSNWVTALEGASPELKASDRVEYGDITDPDDRAFFAQISPLAHVSNVSAPAMVLHGANDPRDPVTESDQFVDGIRRQGGEVEYLRFPDEGHTIRQLSNRIIAWRRIADFLERQLGVAR